MEIEQMFGFRSEPGESAPSEGTNGFPESRSTAIEVGIDEKKLSFGKTGTGCDGDKFLLVQPRNGTVIRYYFDEYQERRLRADMGQYNIGQMFLGLYP